MRQLDDGARAAVRGLQVGRRGGGAQRLHDRLPRGEVPGAIDALRRVPGHGHAPALRIHGAPEHAQLDGGELLRLVDDHVRVLREVAAPRPRGAGLAPQQLEEQRVVLDVERARDGVRRAVVERAAVERGAALVAHVGEDRLGGLVHLPARVRRHLLDEALRELPHAARAPLHGEAEQRPVAHQPHQIRLHQGEPAALHAEGVGDGARALGPGAADQALLRAPHPLGEDGLRALGEGGADGTAGIQAAIEPLGHLPGELLDEAIDGHEHAGVALHPPDGEGRIGRLAPGQPGEDAPRLRADPLVEGAHRHPLHREVGEQPLGEAAQARLRDDDEHAPRIRSAPGAAR